MARIWKNEMPNQIRCYRPSNFITLQCVCHHECRDINMNIVYIKEMYSYMSQKLSAFVNTGFK